MKRLSPEMEQLCKDLIKACKDTEERIEKCVACGYDVDLERTTNDQQLKAVQTTLKEFGKDSKWRNK